MCDNYALLIPQELFKQLPQSRRLSIEEQNEAKKLLSLKANRQENDKR